MVTESRNVTFIETPPHNITNVVDDFYVQDVYDYTSSLNSPSTTINTTDSNSERKEFLQRLSEISNDGSIGTSSNHDPEPAGGSESSRPSTRSRTAGGTDNQPNASKRMSTRASSGGDVALVYTGAFTDKQLNEARRVGLFANTVSPDCLHSQEIVSFVDYALITGNPILQGLPDGDEAIVVPNTYKEAMDLPQAQEWCKKRWSRNLQASSNTMSTTSYPSHRFHWAMKSSFQDGSSNRRRMEP